MAVHSISDLINALDQREFDRVVGTQETSWIDFKQAPYKTDENRRLTPRAKFELAKDVAAFANDEGGCLVLGYTEEIDPTKGLAVAKEVKHLSISSIDLATYKQVLNGNIYPIPRGYSTKWYTKDDKATEGVLVIHVPKGTETPYIVRHLFDEAGTPMQGFGIPRRNDDQTNWWSAEAVHSELARTASARVADSITSQTKKSQVIEDASLTRDSIVEAQGWNEDAVIILQVVPTKGPARLSKFYDDIRQAIEQPQPIRSMGFGLGALGRTAEDVDGAFVLNGSRDTAARLDPNGQFTIALKVSPAFIGWAINQNNTSGSIFINSNVIVEMTYEACRFVREQLAPNGMEEWYFIVDCRNLKKSSVQLAEGRAGIVAEHKLASSDEWIKETHPGADTAADAFKILAEIYALFAIPEQKIPHTGDSKVIEQSIIDLNKHPFQ